MPRFSRSDSLVVYNPNRMRLVTSAHRASLDENSVSLQSGVDPTEYGSIGRMPGGVLLRSGSDPIYISKPNESGFVGTPVRAHCHVIEGVMGGHTLRTKLASGSARGFTRGQATIIKVESASGFQVGDWVAIYKPDGSSPNISVAGRIQGIDGNSLTVKASTAGTWSAGADVPGGSYVQQVTWGLVASASTPPNSSDYEIKLYFSVGVGSNVRAAISDIRLGSIVYVVVHGGAPPISYSTGAVKSIAYDGSGHCTVTLTCPTVGGSWTMPSVSSNDLIAFAIVPGSPITVVFAGAPRACTFVSHSSGRVEKVFLGKVVDLLEDETQFSWSMASAGRDVYAVNGWSRPIRVNGWLGKDYLGWPQLELGTVLGAGTGADTDDYLWCYGGTDGHLTPGTHEVFIRFLDKSVSPTSKSPPYGRTKFTSSSRNKLFFYGKYLLYKGNTTNKTNYPPLIDWMTRATHYEIWMTLAGGGTFYLANSGYISRLLDTTYGDRYGHLIIDMTDDELSLQEVLDEDDIDKTNPPSGTLIAFHDGVTFIAGAGLSTEGHTEVIRSDHILRYSRTDIEEPENFPPENVRNMGFNGDTIRGFVRAGPALVVLGGFSFSVIQRMGTFLSISDSLGYGAGLRWPDAYASDGRNAVWVGDESIWMYDGLTGSFRDIGFDIRDWVRGIKNYEANPDYHVFVRVGYEPRNRLFYVGYVVTLSVYNYRQVGGDCMVYSVDDGVWTRLEGVLLNAPVVALDLEARTTEVAYGGWELYRFLRRCTDTGDRVMICRVLGDGQITQGGFDATGLRGVYETNVQQSSPELTIDPQNTTLNNSALGGTMVLFIHRGTGREYWGVAQSSTSSSAVVSTQLNPLPVGTYDFCIAPIPFRLRFPPIRGKVPFSTKIAEGVIAMADNITPGITPELSVKLLRNFQDDPATGASGTLSLSTSDATVDRDRAVDVKTTGKVIEVQVENLLQHCDFSLVYVGARVVQPGVIREDDSTTV